MPNPEKYFFTQLQSHHCQLPPSDDLEYIKRVSRFNNFFLISEKNLQSYLKVKSLSAIFYEKRRQLRTTRLLVIHPFSHFHTLSQFFLFFLLLASFLLLPFSSAFHGPFYARILLDDGGSRTSFYTLLVLVFLLHLASLLHLLLNFFHGYYLPAKEEIIIHLTGIAKHYLFTFFLPDLISSLPIDAIIVFSRGIHTYAHLPRTQLTLLTLLPLFKFFRLLTLNHCFRTICARFHTSRSTYNLLVAVGLYFLLIHWFACLFMLIPRWINFQPLFPQPPLRNSVSQQYVTCLYVTLTALVNTGLNIRDASQVAPRSLILFLIAFGKIYRIIFIILILHCLSAHTADQLKQMEIMDQVAQYMRIKRFPRDLRRKVIVTYRYLFRREHVKEQTILRLLSGNLRREVLLKMHNSLIHKVRFFSGFPEELILEFVSRFKREVYLENEIVYRVGEKNECLYFISFGTVSLYSANKREVCHLYDGDHFGEISVIFQIKRTVTVIAVEITELCRLEAEEFLDVVKSYPAAYSLMEELARKRYEQSHDSNLPPDEEVLKSIRRPKTKRRREEGEMEKERERQREEGESSPESDSD